MNNDILAQFLGIESDLQEIVIDEEKILEKAKHITNLTTYPEWQTFLDELNKLEESYNRPCEVYVNNRYQASFDSGAKRSIQLIKNFADNQKLIIEKYAKRKEIEEVKE